MMISNRTPERRIRVKIGLIFLMIILYTIGIFMVSYHLKKNTDKQAKELSDSYNMLTYSNQLVLSVQEAQRILNDYLSAPRKTFKMQYDSVSADISRQVVRMRSVLPGEGQYEMLEDIDSLLHEESNIVNRLIVRFRSKNPLSGFDEKIQTIDHLVRDSVVITTHKDTTKVVTSKKDFWGRLKYLFSPEMERDTTVKIVRTEQETRLTSRVDTIMYDSLKNITREASQTYSSNIRKIERQVQELIFAKQNISLHISQLISRFHREMMLTNLEGMHQSERLTHRIFTFAVLSGLFSLLLIVVIITFMMDDLNKGERARVDLVKEKQLTENLMESRHRLMLAVSHDIKTPLSSIMGYLEMWQEDEVNRQKIKQLVSAHNSAKHMLNMLSNFLEFSRREQDSQPLQITRFDVIKQMNEIVEMFLPITREKNIELHFENRVPPPFFIEADETLLTQICTNLISNAVKYTAKGKVHIFLDQKEKMILSVSDTGVGMSPQELESIYLPFSRFNNELRTEGTGLGMYVTKKLTELLHGSISIRSEKGKGTTVTVTFPFQPIDKEMVVSQEKSAEIPPVDYHRILIFEDDAALGNMLCDFLTQKGYEVSLCGDFNTIRSMLDDIFSFDIVFTDMEMIHVTGRDILRGIRRRGAKLPVWLMTAHDDYTIERAVKDGFDGLIQKPIRMGDFSRALGNERKDVTTVVPLNERFPDLLSLFGNDTEIISGILKDFTGIFRSDIELLTDSVTHDRFSDAQRLCHRMLPFLLQLNAGGWCEVLRKMDRLRGKEPSEYPNWKEELSETIKNMTVFADEIERDYLFNSPV